MAAARVEGIVDAIGEVFTDRVDPFTSAACFTT
jgi:hypothetical protein